jgi:hypothetical protein
MSLFLTNKLNFIMLSLPPNSPSLLRGCGSPSLPSWRNKKKMMIGSMQKGNPFRIDAYNRSGMGTIVIDNDDNFFCEPPPHGMDKKWNVQWQWSDHPPPASAPQQFVFWYNRVTSPLHRVVTMPKPIGNEPNAAWYILRGCIWPDALDRASEEFRYLTSSEMKWLALLRLVYGKRHIVWLKQTSCTDDHSSGQRIAIE